MVTGHTDNLEKCRETLLVGASPRRYICEINRDIFDFMEANITDKAILETGLNLVAEAFLAGKKMSDRLKALNNKWDDSDWAPNTDFENDLYRRARRMNLLENIKTVKIQTEGISPDVFGRIVRQLIDYRFEGKFIIDADGRQDVIGQILIDKFPECELYLNLPDGRFGILDFLTSLSFTNYGELVYSKLVYGSIMTHPLAAVLNSAEYRKDFHARSTHHT